MGVRVEEQVGAPATVVVGPLADPDFVDLIPAGTSVAGEFRCADCGYGVVVQRALPQCPMCGGDAWEHRPHVPPRFAD